MDIIGPFLIEQDDLLLLAKSGEMYTSQYIFSVFYPATALKVFPLTIAQYNDVLSTMSDEGNSYSDIISTISPITLTIS